MSHPATIHDPLTIPEASYLLFRLEADVADPLRAAAPVRDTVAHIAAAFRGGQFIPAANWLIALNANTVGRSDDEPDTESPESEYWWRGRTLDDPLQMLAEAFAELTMGITTPYWEIRLPAGPGSA
jgi:hypothetical protein